MAGRIGCDGPVPVRQRTSTNAPRGRFRSLAVPPSGRFEASETGVDYVISRSSSKSVASVPRALAAGPESPAEA